MYHYNISNMRPQNTALRHYLLTGIAKYPEDIAARAARKFGISRQAVNRQLRTLTEEGLIEASGNTRQRRYELVLTTRKEFRLPLKDLHEDVVWNKEISPLLPELPENVLKIWGYGFTEMLNNAIDHSGGTEVQIGVSKDYAQTRIMIVDDGIGIFRKIKDALHLEDERQAVLELAKGKLTTDARHHTGEGIFFTSRAMDSFVVVSSGVHFSHESGEPEDWVREIAVDLPGTGVILKLGNHSTRKLDAVFDEYAAADADYGFTRTVVPVRLAKQPQEMLVSRSQARRLLNRFDRFKVVVLDFEGVDSIGQAFADEIFRVYVKAHPRIELQYEHADKAVLKMIKRAQAADGPIAD